MKRRADEGSFLQNSTPTSRWRSPDTLRFLDSSTPRSIPRFLNRDTNQPITASLELKRNGDWIATSNETEIVHSRILPFAHNGFGQDADWVRANFTNAEEILSVGYADWVDAQVGVGLTNGLYKFVATFEEDPSEIVNLTVGGLSVAVTNAGDYAFLLEKGVDYQFGTFPYLDSVEWGAVDDLGGGEPAPASFVDWGNQATWSVDGGRLDFTPPTPTGYGHVYWVPLFFAEPNVSHLSLSVPSPLFTARLSDCKYAESVSYAWSGGNGDVEFGSPFSDVTPVIFHRFPCWGETSISVTATFGGRTLVSSLNGLTYGTNDATQVRLALSMPNTVLVDPGTNDSCYAAMAISFGTDVVTNGTVTLSCGSEHIAVFSDSNLVSRVTLPLEWDAAEFAGVTYWLKGLEASQTLGDEIFTLQFASPDGTNLVADATTAVRIGNVRLPGAPNDGLIVSLGTTTPDAYLWWGYGFAGVRPPKWKCNQFVARMIRKSGLTVPAQYSTQWGDYPPVANDWANGTPIEGWQWLGRDLFIQPGFVVGDPVMPGPGHCGIIDFDGEGIAAGSTKVYRVDYRWHNGRSGYNKYVPNERCSNDE